MRLACVLAAAASVVVLLGPAPPRHLRSRLRCSSAKPVPRARRTLYGWRWLLPLLCVLGAAGLLLLRPSGLLLIAAAALVVGGLMWLYTSGRRRRESARGRQRTLELCDALAAEMRAGQPAARALGRVAEQYPLAAAAARACVLGGDVSGALRWAASAPGAHGMATVAAAWQVAESSGSGLVTTLDRVAEGLRADDATGGEVAAALAPARATARMLAVLPAFGLLLGAGLGGNPLALLLGTVGGNALLLAGIVLALAGMVWVEHLADGVETR